MLEGRLVLAALPTTPLAIAASQAVAVAGSEGIWSLGGAVTPSADPTLTIRPDHAEAFSIDFSQLGSVLSLAPMEFTTQAAAAPLALPLPMPDGSIDWFAVVDAPVFDNSLGAYNGIHTYRGQGIDDPAATVRLDLTPQGFHAQILSPSGAVYIDPARHLDPATPYLSYYKHDLTAPSSLVEGDIEGVDALDTAAISTSSIPTSGFAPSPVGSTFDFVGPVAVTGDDGNLGRPSGSVLRTYRTAVAVTGEYTAFHGGTVNAGLAAIVTAINRISGIYETELTIRLSLIPNNNLIVYTNGATDPYANTVTSPQLSVNQTNIDSVIGNANYDIGHLFTTDPGGGLAGLGVVGRAGKAQGGTGLSSPTGDPFYVDYVAHEMGHQFGGNHTFNTPNAGGNRVATAAYEPGSGSTIMAYAGITGATADLQPNSDPYFHWKSFDEIIRYVDQIVPGAGTRTNTGNSVPTVDAGPDFTIPANTPFVLTAAGSDADGDPLTYDWEESDLGVANNPSPVNANPPTGDNGTSPIIRSLVPSTSPSRTVPRLSNLIANTRLFGEQLPTTTRTLRFRITVRDNRGGVNDGGADGVGVSLGADKVLSVINTGGAFAVTSQNAATSFNGNSTQTVTWDVAGTTANGINVANVRILLSTDGGLTYGTVLLASTPNNGSASFVVPNITTSTARIRVEAIDNIFFDINNANISITAAQAAATTVQNVTSTAANGLYAAGAVIPITVTFADAVTVTGTPTLALNSGGTATYVSGSGSSSLVFNYIVAAGQNTPDLDYASTTALSLSGGTIVGPGAVAATLTLPAPGSAGSLGANKNIAIDTAAPTVSQFRVVFGSQSFNLIGSTRTYLPWQVTGIQVVFSEPIGTGSAASLTGVSATGIAGLGTNTLTFGLNALTSGAFNTSLLATGGNALLDLAGNALNSGTPFSQMFRVLYGDFTDDGVVSSTDMTGVLGATTAYNVFADLNGDGVVDINDVRIARSRIGASFS